jgi:serpin B
MKFKPLAGWCVILGLNCLTVVGNAQDATVNAAPSPSTTALVQADNRFALDLFRQVSSNAAENTFLSPYSISTALAMAWKGAEGETAAQMAKAFHFSALPAGEVTAGFAALQQAITQAQEATGAQLAVANSLWPERKPENPFLPEYLRTVERDFASVLIPLNFKSDPDGSRLQINQWVADKTQDRIRDMLQPGDVTPAMRLALVNAIYFKGTWAAPFTPRLTRSGPFHLAGGAAKDTALMHQTIQSYQAQYADITNDAVPCQLLSLNYFDRSVQFGGRRGPGGRSGAGAPGVSLLVVLPRSAADLGKLEQNLTADQLAGWIGRLAGAKVEVFLPKFRIENRFSLEHPLAALGAVDAFILPDAHGGADFSGMNGAHDLFISKVIHQSFVDVDEQGTEAAAATFVGMAGAGAPRPTAPPPVFRADHPFLFFIRENATGSILFMGRLANPVSVATAAGR